MLNAHASTESAANPSRWIWLLTLAVAGLPVIFGLYQVWIFFDEAFPHLYWSRTFPALAGVALGVAGIAAPLCVIIKRNVFYRWSLARQGLTFGAVVLLMFLAYLTPFILLADAAKKSHAIFTYTPSVFLHYYKNDGPPFYFGVVGGLGTGHGSGHVTEDRVVVEWNAWLEPPDLTRAPGPDPVVQLRCEATQDADRLTVDLEIKTGRTVRFDTRGFINPNVQQDDKPVALPIELVAGIHRFTIRAKR